MEANLSFSASSGQVASKEDLLLWEKKVYYASIGRSVLNCLIVLLCAIPQISV